ncbi:MAG: transposase [Solirubrobacteraceae bacterium]
MCGEGCAATQHAAILARFPRSGVRVTLERRASPGAGPVFPSSAVGGHAKGAEPSRDRRRLLNQAFGLGRGSIGSYGSWKEVPAELRERAVRTALEPGRSIAQVARDLDVQKKSLRMWVLAWTPSVLSLRPLGLIGRRDLSRLPREAGWVPRRLG